MKLSLSIAAFFLIIVASIPLSFFMLYNDLQDSADRQYTSMYNRIVKLQEKIEKEGSLQNVDEDFLEGIVYSGEFITVDKGSDGSIEVARQLPPYEMHIKPIDVAYLKFFEPFLSKQLRYPQREPTAGEVHDQPMVVHDDGQMVASTYQDFNLNGNKYRISMDKDITASITIPFDTFTLNLFFMILWFVVLALIAVIFFLKTIFRPLEKAVNQAVEKVDAEHFHTKIPDPHYGQEVSRVVHIFNEMLEKCAELADNNVNTMQDVSHEVRTRLTAIKQSVDVIRMYGVEDKDLVVARLAAIELNITRATDIMTTILELARLKQGARQITGEVHSVEALMENYHEFKIKRFPDFAIHAQMDMKEPAQVCIERQHFFLAMNPIMENAVRYSVDSNTILLKLEEGENDTVEFSITNHGRQISKEDIPHLFDRYFRGGNVGNVKAGSGLGLTITKEVIHLYGGDIRVESDKNGKTKFTLIFPKHKQSKALKAS